MKTKFLFIIAISLLMSCVAPSPECKNPIEGKAIFVAYRVAKHSHMWFQNTKTGQIYDIDGLGGRREPNISLGTIINVTYCDNEIIFNKDQYIRETDRETIFVPLSQKYSDLYY